MGLALAMLPLELWLVDSRAAMLAPERLEALGQGQARVKAFPSPLLEQTVHDLPAGAHLVVMTHDHAEDLFILEAALGGTWVSLSAKAKGAALPPRPSPA